ncbi:MAG: carbamoyl phosphate synthase large subunit, partial [Anaerotardibacter sp.]
LINIQFAIKDMIIYVIEANPRASRTVPFISKATGVPLAKLASRIMAGEKIADFNLPDDCRYPDHFCVKEAVMPFDRFPGTDIVLGPEMKSTGEVMGIASTFPAAFAKTQAATNAIVPEKGTCFLSVCDRDKRAVLPLAQQLVAMGYSIVSTAGTARALKAADIPCEVAKRVSQPEPNIKTLLADGTIDFLINTPFSEDTHPDGYVLRTHALRQNLPYYTTLAGAQAFVTAIASIRNYNLPVIALQDLDK